MSKKTKTLTTVADSAKRKANNSSLTKKNLKDSTKELKAKPQVEREVMYLYPKDCTTPDQRKEFRRKARATARRNEKAIAKLEASTERGSKKELQETAKEFAAWKQSIYTHPN